jgi:hypothetical protein
MFRRVKQSPNQKSNTRMRNMRGSMMPFIAMCVILFMVTIGVCTELMRDFETVNQLDYATQVASIYSLGSAVNDDRTYSNSTAQANIQNYLLRADTASWNPADSGPNLNTTNQPVLYDAGDINFIPNPAESAMPTGRQEFFLDLTVRRQGTSAIPQVFMPLAYINFTGVGLPAGVKTFSPVRTIEFLGQPATTIGAGDPTAPTSSTPIPPTRYQFSCLPIAISNVQFAPIATSTSVSPATTFTLDVDGISGQIHGCFVDLVGIAGGTSPFNTASTANIGSQLIPLLNYFIAGGTAPSSVKYTDGITAFNVNDPTFPWTTMSTECTALVNANANTNTTAGTNKNFIVPVIQLNPSTTASNSVAGFAWMQIRNFTFNTTQPSQSLFTVSFSDSVPVRNACNNPFLQTTNTNGNITVAAPPPPPFSARNYDPTTNAVGVRPFGVVLAPSPSPRMIIGG